MNTTYNPIAKALHWFMAFVIFGLLALGFVMHDMPLSPEKLQYYSWHKWAGVSVFALVWVRLAWRLLNPPPPFANAMPRHVQLLAHAGHAALYVLMVIIPLSGWLMSSAKGVQTVWFGHLLEEVHGLLNWALMLLIAGHVSAALKHHLIDRDDTLTRMLPHTTSQGHTHE
jgi:cytochrome b561